MKKLNINSNSIVVKLTLFMVVIILFQSILMIGSILVRGTISNLKENAFEVFSDKVGNRKGYLESEMANRWSNIDLYVKDIQDIKKKYYGENGLIPNDATNDFLDDAAESVVAMLRNTSATGSFLILTNQIDADPNVKDVVYLRDYDPLTAPVSGELSDLQMMAGPSAISKKNHIPLDSSWRKSLLLTESNQNFYQKPYEAAMKFGDNRYLSYWCPTFELIDYDRQIITYSRPLISDDGQVWAIIGIDLTVEYLVKSLPPTDLDKDNYSAYVLGMLDEEKQLVTPIVESGHINKRLQRDAQGRIPLLEIDSRYNMSDLDSTGHIKIYAHTTPINFYSGNNPYQDDKWVLMGVIQYDALMSSIIDLNKSMFFAFTISIILGIFGSYIAGYSFSKPIMVLADNVRNSEPSKPLALAKTNLSEIDELSTAIEALNQDVLDFTSKMSYIISTASMPVGTFDYNDDDDEVYCTDLVASILEISALGGQDNKINKQVFLERIAEIQKFPELDEDNTFQINPEKWVRIKMVEQANKTIGVTIDVSKEITEKQTIKFERDYDTLTGLYNRFAFHTMVSKRFNRGELGVAAFMMLDLDNLKYVNDTYGHDFGDLYIKKAAEIIVRFLPRNTICSRISGDEFYVFFYEFTDQNEIRELVQKLYIQMDHEKLDLPSGGSLKMRASAGISWYGEHSIDYKELMKFADFAMYEGKHSIKGEVREFDKKYYDKEHFMLSGKEELNKIFDNQLIDYAFQPIISVKDGEIYGYEALMRPQSQTLNTPMQLLKIATAQSVLWKVEKTTFYKTLSIYERLSSCFGNAKLFINSIPNQVLKNEEYEELKSMYPHALKNLVVEIIENERIEEDKTTDKIKTIRDLGALIALDDYGSGYNSEIALLNLQPDIVKIDRYLVMSIENDSDRQELIAKVVDYAKERNIKVLAEGIETYDELKTLIALGVDYLQGYYLGMPDLTPNQVNPRVKQEILFINQELS